MQEKGLKCPDLEFITGNFVQETDWAKKADIVFANATCFDLNMVKSISENLKNNMKKGGVVIITTNEIDPN